MKTSQILGIIFAVALIIFSIVYPVPEKDVNISSSSRAFYSSWSENIGAKYINGDCYNYQMEASLKAGYLAGVLAMKSFTFVGGLFLLFLTLYSRVKCKTIEEQARVIAGMVTNSENITKNVSDESDGHAEAIITLPVTSEENTLPNNESENNSVEEND